MPHAARTRNDCVGWTPSVGPASKFTRRLGSVAERGKAITVTSMMAKRSAFSRRKARRPGPAHPDSCGDYSLRAQLICPLDDRSSRCHIRAQSRAWVRGSCGGPATAGCEISHGVTPPKETMERKHIIAERKS